MNEAPLHSWRNAWLRRSVFSLLVLTVVAIVVGFVWLPSVGNDFPAQGLWASICRAAGVPTAWGSNGAGEREGPSATRVVLERSMAAAGTNDAVGRGATLAQNCTGCHGAQGMSADDTPNLAGQYPEVVIKQLHDFQGDQRSSPIMQAMAKGLSDRDINDLAAYYASLPKARNPPATYAAAVPALARVGAPLRNIAPCISCHGSVAQKLGSPWLEGMPKAYLIAQLASFRSGERRNDSHAQMRNMVRSMTAEETAQVAGFYARPGLAGEAR